MAFTRFVSTILAYSQEEPDNIFLI